MVLLITVVFLTLSVSALCSLFEATLYSTRTATLEAARVAGPHKKGAERFLKMKRNLASPTAAILILNTVANTAGAAVAGMLAAEEVGRWFIPVFSVSLTLGILFFSEILPKTYGAVQWRRSWAAVVWPLAAMENLLKPLIYITRLISNLLVPKGVVKADTEDEILAMIRLSGRAGELTPSEQEMLTTVIAFDEILAAEVMVPAEKIISLRADLPLEQSLRTAIDAHHTRYPLVGDQVEDFAGLVHIKDLLGLADKGNIIEVARPLTRVPGKTPIGRLLREMQRSRRHMSVVTDDDGAMSGIITLEDILGQIVGPVEEAATDGVLAEGSNRYRVAGSMLMTEFNRQLGLDIEHASDTDTLSSLLVHRLGRLLQPGDKVELEGAVACVVEVVGTQATKISITLESPDERP